MIKKIKELLLQYKIYVKYFISGCIGAFVNLSSLFIFTEFFKLWYILSAILAFFISFFVSFNLQKKWTFRNDDKKVVRQAFKYFIITSLSLAFNISLLYLLVEIAGLWYLLAQVIIYGFLSIFSFLLYKFVVFKQDQL